MNVKLSIVLKSANLKLTLRPNQDYLVQASIPLPALGLLPNDDLILRGDFGVTHGGSDGRHTRLLTYWSNQQTGIVDDAVFAFKIMLKNWGEFIFNSK